MDHLKGASLRMAQKLLANIRMGMKGLPGKNTLAYLKIATLGRKIYITFAVIYEWS
jgi:hypothetical protein